MRRYPPRRLPAVAPAAALAFATPATADTRSLTAPIGSTKGSVVMDARFIALQEPLQMESR